MEDGSQNVAGNLTATLGWQTDANLRFFGEELLKAHYPSFHRAALIAAHGKLRRICGNAHVEDAFQDACILALSGACEDFGHLIEPLRQMAESTNAISGQQAAFDALEIVLGSRNDFPDTFQKAKSQARQFVGYFAGVMFNTVRTPLRNDLHRSEILAANAEAIVVRLNHGCDDPEARAVAMSAFNHAAASELQAIEHSYGRPVRDMFAAFAFVHISTNEPVDTLVEILENDYEFGFPFSRMTVYRKVKAIRKNFLSLEPSYGGVMYP